MNSIYAIIVFLCVQELTAASYYRIPKRYFKTSRQERKQVKNVPLKNTARNTPVFLPVPLPETSAQIISEEIVTDNPPTEAVLNEEHNIPILKPCQPIFRQDLPRMTTLPILTILPIVASLPVVNIGQKIEKLPLETADLPNDSLDFDEEIEDVDESTVSVDIVEEIKYEIVERNPNKSQIWHKVRRIEEFKRNIFIDRREDAKKY